MGVVLLAGGDANLGPSERPVPEPCDRQVKEFMIVARPPVPLEPQRRRVALRERDLFGGYLKVGPRSRRKQTHVDGLRLAPTEAQPVPVVVCALGPFPWA